MAQGLGWAGLRCRRGVASLSPETEMGLSILERLCPAGNTIGLDRQQQQAISIHFFLEDLGFRI